MSLQASLDAFKADFEAAKPPYHVSLSIVETMHHATVELIASGATNRALELQHDVTSTAFANWRLESCRQCRGLGSDGVAPARE